MSNAGVAFTDSGGLQEETTILRIPCLTLRHNTERPVTITAGTNMIVGPNKQRILNAVRRIQLTGSLPARPNSRTAAPPSRSSG
jgi:UDP-N-acetylglucosamine 2-epimerase (non-hydrolysing)